MPLLRLQILTSTEFTNGDYMPFTCVKTALACSAKMEPTILQIRDTSHLLVTELTSHPLRWEDPRGTICFLLFAKLGVS